MKIEFVGKFFDNHSLTLINRQIVTRLADKHEVCITALDAYDPKYNVDKKVVKKLKDLQKVSFGEDAPDIQIRHCYPPVWNWPNHDETKIVYIQPWEYPKVPFEWQYKFETFADALIVPSNYIKRVFTQGGLDPRNAFTIPNGFDQTLFNKDKSDVEEFKGIKKDRFNFVFVGNPQWRKGLDTLLNSWRDSFKAYDKCTLIIKDNPAIYGQNNIVNEIVKLQFKSGCAEIIYIDDNLSDQEMAQLYKLSNVVVHPYRAEGFGMHIQEAIACGCLPITPNIGPHQDYIPDDVGLKIPVERRSINITDSNIFAMKPGDSMSLMSSHTFVNEPSGQHLTQALKYVYHHHNKQDLFVKVDELELSNTWDKVADEYEKVLLDVNARKFVNRTRN